MKLEMTISGVPFIGVDFDFIGKPTIEARLQYLEDIALVLQTEYAKEIADRQGVAEFFYIGASKSDEMVIHDYELQAFAIRVRQLRVQNQIAEL